MTWIPTDLIASRIFPNISCCSPTDSLHLLTVCPVYYNKHLHPPCPFSPALAILCPPVCPSWPPSSLKAPCCRLASGAVPSWYWWWPCQGAVFWLVRRVHPSGFLPEQCQAELGGGRIRSFPALNHIFHLKPRVYHCSAQSHKAFRSNFPFSLLPETTLSISSPSSRPPASPKIRTQKASEIKLGVIHHRIVCDYVESVAKIIH